MDQDREPDIAAQLRRVTRRWSQPADQWRTKVQRWVDAGIVSSAQGVEIVAMESSEGAPATGHDETPSSLSPVVELLSYVGILAVVVGAALFLSHYWNATALAGHLVAAVAFTVAGLVGAVVVEQFGGASAHRLSGFLRLIGTGGVVMTTALVVGGSAKQHHGLSLLCVGIVVLVVSAILWRNRDRSLQFLTTLLGVVLTVAGIDSVAHLHATSSEVALMVWFFAVAVGLMSLQMLRPAPTALVAAELGSFVGALALSFPNHLGGVLLGLLSTLSAVGLGFALERPPIIVLGAMGFFMFDFRIFSIYLRNGNAALGAFILGLALILVALCQAWRSSIAERNDAVMPTDAHAEAEWYEPG